MFQKPFHLCFLLFLVSCFSFNYSFSQSSAGNLTELPLKHNKEFSRFLVAFDGGVGRLLGDAQTAEYILTGFGISIEQSKSYYSDLKSGYQASTSAYYLINSHLGVGVDYNYFTTGNSFEGYFIDWNLLQKFYGKFSEKVYTNFVGVSILGNLPLGSKWNVFGKFTQGKCFYRNETQTILTPSLYTADAKAFKLEAGTAYKLVRHVSVVFSMTYFKGFLFNVDLNNGTETTNIDLHESGAEDLSRLNFNAGFQFDF